MSDTSETPETADTTKKRVRASITDVIAIGRCLDDHVVGRDDGAGGFKHSYVGGMTDERIAAKCVPHLAAHHVTTVREALYPAWEKRPAEMAVEDRLTAIEDQLEHYFKRRLDALDREVDGPRIESRLADIESRLDAINKLIDIIESRARGSE